MRECAICGKGPVVGSQVTHRGMLKVKGGVGRRTVRVNLRRFLPNLQSATVILKGTVKRVRVCTACLRSGRVPKAPLHPARRSPTASALPR
ncbi:MAG: 50S ribosomal protein L28 [Candidatus Omnitrophica bacterium]|nr:50S ribosomal protein L28 [Candidatus Omnitrophota bacterium]